MSTAPKKPDPNTGSQGEAPASKAPDSNDNENRRYEIVERGQLHTLNYRCYFRDTQTKTIVSPFHDIPLINEQSSKENQTEIIYNMVVEVPRWTNAKMEINKQFKLNPLVQDVKNGKPRFVHNVFPYHGYLWNYGALPQTWEDPNHVDEDTQTTGDNDPVDVCEIGTTLHATGSIIPVKIVGVLGLIDEGETDWKLIGIDVRDKLASQVFSRYCLSKQNEHFLLFTHRFMTLKMFKFNYLVYSMQHDVGLNTTKFQRVNLRISSL